jgi:hypothetical protein
MRVRRLPREASAAERARWLAELAAVLAEAQVVAWGLGTAGGHAEAMELYSEIELAIAEVQSLRLGGRLERPGEVDPEWRKNLPWASG